MFGYISVEWSHDHFRVVMDECPRACPKGYNYNSRCGESIIKNSNNNFLIAKDIDEYIKKAILLSKDIEKLKTIRKNLYDNVLSTDIFDTQKFTKNFTEILLTINKNYNSNNL